MADDIVTRIAEHPHYSEYDATGCLRCEAADEIERLRAEIARLRAAGDALAAAIRNHDLHESQIKEWEEARR